MNLIYGVLRRRQYLDYCLALVCRQPLHKLHPFVYQALAVGLYQALFLDRIPESAAVNETVNALKAARLPTKLQGLVNAILRNCIRRKALFPSPDGLEEKPFTNHPSWLTDRWQRQFGREEMLRICACNNRQPPLVLRVNPLVTTRDELRVLIEQSDIATRLGLHAPQALVLPEYHGVIQDLPGYDQGAFQVQDESAQLVSFLLGPFSQADRILDGCAGLGGKTAHMLELTAGFDTSLTAVEPNPRRLQLFKNNLARLFREPPVSLHCCNLHDFSRQTRDRFDRILIDAPCSGTGVIRRHPDIRWNRSAHDFDRYAETQRQLLALAAQLLVPGGTLVYVTCSLEPEENQDIVHDFLSSHPIFKLTDCTPFRPESAGPLVRDGFFQPRPQESTDGFFAARLSAPRK